MPPQGFELYRRPRWLALGRPDRSGTAAAGPSSETPWPQFTKVIETCSRPSASSTRYAPDRGIVSLSA